MNNRREKEIEAMRELIISAAREIISKEGFDNLSIRKIAKIIDYSPSIIYHYFKDKEEILNSVMKSGYMKIVNAVSRVDVKNLSPEEKLKKMTRNYIKEALKMPEEFMAVQLNQSPQALKYTSSLFRGASKEKPALLALSDCIKEIYGNEAIDEELVELITQMVAVSTMGLIFKLIVEKDLDDEQRNIIINFFIEDVVIKISKIK